MYPEFMKAGKIDTNSISVSIYELNIDTRKEDVKIGNAYKESLSFKKFYNDEFYRFLPEFSPLFPLTKLNWNKDKNSWYFEFNSNRLLKYINFLIDKNENPEHLLKGIELILKKANEKKQGKFLSKTRQHWKSNGNKTLAVDVPKDVANNHFKHNINIYLCITINGNNLYEEYRDKYSNSVSFSLTNDKRVCSLCGKKTRLVKHKGPGDEITFTSLGRQNKYFISDKLGISSDLSGNFEDRFAICPACFMRIYRGMKYIQSYQNVKIGGELYLSILPITDKHYEIFSDVSNLFVISNIYDFDQALREVTKDAVQKDFSSTINKFSKFVEEEELEKIRRINKPGASKVKRALITAFYNNQLNIFNKRVEDLSKKENIFNSYFVIYSQQQENSKTTVLYYDYIKYSHLIELHRIGIKLLVQGLSLRYVSNVLGTKLLFNALKTKERSLHLRPFYDTIIKNDIRKSENYKKVLSTYIFLKEANIMDDNLEKFKVVEAIGRATKNVSQDKRETVFYKIKNLVTRSKIKEAIVTLGNFYGPKKDAILEELFSLASSDSLAEIDNNNVYDNLLHFYIGYHNK